MTPTVRWCAWGGVIGPSAFVAAWIVAGTTSRLSPVDDAISDLAAVHASTRATMTIGFVAFGLGLLVFAIALRRAPLGGAWIAAAACGAFTLGVAATPLGGWTGDSTHATFAGLGYVALVALPLLAVRAFSGRGESGWARASVLAGAIAALCLLASTLGPEHGLWQRLGLTAGDAWIFAVALGLLRSSRAMWGREGLRSVV